MAKAHDGTQELDQQGAYKRTDSIFRKFIGSPEFPAESGRYHLYVSYACPWASRCLAVRALKGLEDCISISVVAPLWDETKPGVDEHRGWVFKSAEEVDGCIPDDVNGYKTVRDIYEAANDTLGKYSVPILWDKKSRTIVNNESSEIIRMFSSDFNEFAKHPKVCLFPEELRADIEAVNEFVYPCINNGVYRAGFATAQAPYEHAVNELFGALDRCEEILSKQRYLAGARLTEADIRLFVTLVRFDEVYVGHFKCNRRRIMDYDNLLNFTRVRCHQSCHLTPLQEVYQIPGIAATVNMKHIKDHYHGSHKSINKYGIIPVGPAEGTDFTVPHNRDRFPLVPFDAPQTGK